MDGDFGFVNNVVFNWVHRTTDGGDDKSRYNIINNYWKPGPATPKDAPVGHRILKPEARRGKNAPVEFGKAYVNGNVVEGNERVTKDNWDGGVQLGENYNASEILPKIRVDQPFPIAPVTTTDAKTAYEHVLANAGATLPKRDAVDTRVIEMVRTGRVGDVKPSADVTALLTRVKFSPQRIQEIHDLAAKGIISDIAQVGGHPEYKGTPHKDSDGDGMPDEWESAHGLNPNDPADAASDKDGDGYTTIEDFINGAKS
jgi:hypothetical protein